MLQPSIAASNEIEIDYDDADDDSASEYSCDSQAYAVSEGAPELMLTVPTPPTVHELSEGTTINKSLLYVRNEYEEEEEYEDNNVNTYYYDDYFQESSTDHYSYDDDYQDDYTHDDYYEDSETDDDLDPAFLDAIHNPLRSFYAYKDHELEDIPEETMDELDTFNAVSAEVKLALPTESHNYAKSSLTTSPVFHLPSSAASNLLSSLAARPLTCRGPKMPWGIKV
jgi:hypothetical protein